MAIINHDDWELSGRGKKDAERHRKKIDDSIRKKVKDVISEESIITRKKGKKVKIPIKGLKDYRFIYGGGSGNGGAGQGEGEEGDVIGRKQKKGQGGQNGQGSKPGEEKGEGYMETEVDIDYLIEIMFEDLGLPYIEEKTKKENLVPKGWKFETISKVGTLPRLHKTRTLIEAMKRTVAYAIEIMDETNCSEDDAHKALKQANGDLEEAIIIIKEGKLNGGDRHGIYIEDDDLRFKQIERDVELHSNAAVIAMMDVSGSMDREKKYLARSMLFWLTEFLKKMYDNVEIKFIIHTTEAEIVDEEGFFKTTTSGGTKCSSAFEKANYIIDTEYPLDSWNVYCVYLSDGEDWSPKETITKIHEMLDKKVNMLSYCEVKPEKGLMYDDFALMKAILKEWKFEKRTSEGTNFFKNEEKRFLLSIIRDKSHIYPALKHMLFQKVKK